MGDHQEPLHRGESRSSLYGDRNGTPSSSSSSSSSSSAPAVGPSPDAIALVGFALRRSLPLLLLAAMRCLTALWKDNDPDSRRYRDVDKATGGQRGGGGGGRARRRRDATQKLLFCTPGLY